MIVNFDFTLVQFVYFWWSKRFSKNYEVMVNLCQKPYCGGYSYIAVYQMQWGPCNAAQGLNHFDFSPTQKFVTFVLCPPHNNWEKLFLNGAFVIWYNKNLICLLSQVIFDIENLYVIRIKWKTWWSCTQGRHICF